jgi:hypothetical protein
MILYFQKLQDLGKYKIERTEDYDMAKKDGEDLSYNEMIRVKGSRPEKCFTVPSHLYKYGRNTLRLYLKDHKSSWKKISKILNKEIDMHSEEAEFTFDYTKFDEISKILPFVRKKTRKTTMNSYEREKARLNIQKVNQKRRHIIKNFNENLNETKLDDYLCVEVQ